MKPKFKVGDKIKILPTAVNIGVGKDEVGKVGIIIDNLFLDKYIQVLMDKPRWGWNRRWNWAMSPSDAIPFIKPGQQLLFSFMETKE